MSILPSVTDHLHPASPQPIVLVVDDDPMVRQTVTMLLQDYGFRVVTAGDGVEGLRKFREVAPDVVLTDIIMPQKEGISLIVEMRRIRRDVGIIAMSGGGRMGNSDYVTIATKLGANAGLQKPFDDLQLVEAVRALAERGSAAPVPAAAA